MTFKRKTSLLGVAAAALVIAASAIADSSAPVPGRVQPTKLKAGKPMKIAVIGIVNNPFWSQVKQGADRAAAVLQARGTEVLFVDAGNQVTVPAVGNAIAAQVASGVDAIASLVPGNGICSYIKKAVSQHVAFATINGDATCTRKAGSLFFHGQDLYNAGAKAGQLMCKSTASLASSSKPGKVGISTEQFAFQALELRRKGFIAGLEKNCPWVTPVNEGAEDKADPLTIRRNVKNFITSTPNLVGVYMTGGNPYVAANEICAEKKQRSIKMIAFDFTTENALAIKKGCLTAAIGQDPFGQSYDSIMYLYNWLVAHKKPSAKYFIPTSAVVGTKANIDKVLVAQSSGSPGI
jgi:ABC-type sugar transport system substrate-binding protein